LNLSFHHHLGLLLGGTTLYIWDVASLHSFLPWEWSDIFVHVGSWNTSKVHIVDEVASGTVGAANCGVEVTARNSSIVRGFIHFLRHRNFHRVIHQLLLHIHILLLIVLFL
jgi:hypothetical protein